MSLSERQRKILEFVKTFTRANGYPPTIREIGKAVNISSTSVVNYNLDALQRAKMINRDRTVSRGIRLADGLDGGMSSHLVKVPLLGPIAAGQPLQVFDDLAGADEQVEVPRDMVSGQDNIFALEVQGYSMIDALINDGDIVIFRQTQTANNGEMVAAWLPEQGETTLKRFYHEGKKVRLQPENQTMDPIYVDADKVEVHGRVVAVLRQIE